MARRLSGFTSDLFTSLTDSGTNEAGRADNAVNEAADPTQGKDRRVVISAAVLDAAEAARRRAR